MCRAWHWRKCIQRPALLTGYKLRGEGSKPAPKPALSRTLQPHNTLKQAPSPQPFRQIVARKAHKQCGGAPTLTLSNPPIAPRSPRGQVVAREAHKRCGGALLLDELPHATTKRLAGEGATLTDVDNAVTAVRSGTVGHGSGDGVKRGALQTDYPLLT